VSQVDIVADALLAGLFEAFGFDGDMLVHWDQVLTLNHKLGHRVLLSDVPMPKARRASVRRAGLSLFRVSLAHKGLEQAHLCVPLLKIYKDYL
jgi:hypothetical protein